MTVTAIKIRQATHADVLALGRMKNALWPDWGATQHAKEAATELADSRWILFVAEDSDGVLIGFAEIYLRPFANGCDSRPVPFLEGIWVDPKQRRLGVGKKLIGAGEDWARAHAFSEIGSDTEIENETSIQVHGRWGFQEMERVVHFKKVL